MSEETLSPPKLEQREQKDKVVIRFAGDSGDGMQLVGTRFTATSALFGNDLATFPNFPAEIRAPAGTLPGVSSFQVHIADWDILTPGDRPDVLVVMNPAALRANLGDLEQGGLILANRDAFDERNLHKAGYESNPLEDGTLEEYRLLTVPMEELTKEAVADTGVKGRATLRSKNFFALGLISWMFNRPTEPVLDWIRGKFGDDVVGAANTAAYRAGYNFGIVTQEFQHTYEIQPATLPAGTYTNITGNQAVAWGLIAAAHAAKLPLLYGSYPITPASTILEELARHKNFGVRTFQAEDEIAAAGIALGASFAGHLGATGTSGPGVALKSETMSLGVQVELPMIVVNVQRAGPSTGMPTKVEQADLLMALHGRHGEAPLPVVAAGSPSDAFDTTIEACRIALKYMTPVIVLSDGYIATSSEPWRLPDTDLLPDLSVSFASAEKLDEEEQFFPYERDEETLSRPWAIPGTAGLEHRIGGLEHEDRTGNVSYDPLNHERMTELRAAKIERIARDIAPAELLGSEDADVLVVSWGGTFAAVRAGVNNANRGGASAAHLHLRHLNPLPPNLGELVTNAKTVLVPELNGGQLAMVIRAKYLVDVRSYTKVQGMPFKTAEIAARIFETINDEESE